MTLTSETSEDLKPRKSVDELVQAYGDLLFDLCESVLWSAANAQIAFRSILKEIKAHLSSNNYRDNERPWILRLTCEKLRGMVKKYGRKPTASEQIELDAASGISTRLKHFHFYFHRLTTDDQILLLLRDKYGLPYSEISSALQTSEGSLKIRRQQALRTLEEWLWDAK